MFEDFFVSYSHGNEKCLYYYVPYSFFHEYHFVLKTKHEIKVVREDTN